MNLIDATPTDGYIISNIPDNQLLRQKIMGMTYWKFNLLVVYHKTAFVHFFKVISLVPFHAVQTMHPAGLCWPRGIAANERTASAYIVDWNRMFSGTLYKMDENGKALQLAPIELQPMGVSVTEDGGSIVVIGCTPLRTVLPFVRNNNKIFIFLPNGTPVKSVDLQEDLNIPRHVIPVPGGESGEYWVVHGWGSNPGQVVRVNSKGEVLSGRYGVAKNRPNEMLSNPLSLHDYGHGGIFVVDYKNHRVHVLNYQLKLVAHVLTEEENGIRYPRHVCMDVKSGYLFVGLESGEIRGFHVRDAQE